VSPRGVVGTGFAGAFAAGVGLALGAAEGCSVVEGLASGISEGLAADSVDEEVPAFAWLV
jgi:hypothetical protein